MDKTLFLKGDERNFQKHPVFEGVSILEIASGAEIGLHIPEAYVNGEWEGISTGDYLLVP